MAIPVVAALFFVLGWCAKPPNYIGPVIPVTKLNHWVGEKESSLRRLYGEPVVEKVGYHPLLDDRGLGSIPVGPIRTLKFREGSGWLWVWLEQRGDHWGCFRSFWYDDEYSQREFEIE